MNKNYTVYHCHTMLSNIVTNIDSITTYEQYIQKAKECGMTALAFSEHGSIASWTAKKEAIESAGMKYIHAQEFYVTEKLFVNVGDTPKQVRDNYHCVLIAKNYEGVKELNVLSSAAFNREDGHYYYNPRITFDELVETSDNIIICTACIASILGRGSEELQKRFIDFLKNNSNRCFLEIQHHNTYSQKEYNLKMYELGKQTGIRLIAATDTHCLNKEHEIGRQALQNGKNVYFDGEDGWDLTFKTYEELVSSFRIQGVLDEETFLTAIENTNVMADMIEPFELDKSFKFPKVYENPEEVLYNKLYSEEAIQKIVNEGFSREEVVQRIDLEFNTFIALNSVDYILLIDYIIQWANSNGIFVGPGRGSAVSSLALYMLGVTDVNPLKYGFYFWRFLDKDKYSAPDVDTDWPPSSSEKIKKFMLDGHLGLEKVQTAQIITFNTIALRGAIRDIGRGLNMSLVEVDEIAKAVHEINDDENKETVIDDEWREKYPELFKYVDIVIGTIVSVGTHPSGILVTDHDIITELGTCMLSGNPYQVCCLDMKQLDALGFVKEDILQLDTVQIVNDSCKLAGIERISPRNLTFDDDNVWDSIREDTSLIFQMNSNYGQRTASKMYSPKIWAKIKENVPNMTKFDLMAYINALIRPCGKNVYPIVTEGNVRKTGIKDIDDVLAAEMGYPILQETQMEFVQKFCGYSFLESDALRKCVAKKKGTRKQLPKIKEGFEKNAKIKYNLTQEQSDEIIEPFLQCILDATRYAFGRGHDYSYSCISYECAWLRYYYPLQYLTSCLNAWNGDVDKTNDATQYAEKIGIKINSPKFRYSKAEYFFDEDTNCIYKGTSSIKYMNAAVSDALYELRDMTFNNFTDVLKAVQTTGIDARQLGILIKLDYFSEFGNARELMLIYNNFVFFKQGNSKQINKDKITDQTLYSIIARNANETEKQFNKLNCDNILLECEEYIRCQNVTDFHYKMKIQDEKEYMGYISLKTGKQEDRPKVIVLEKRTLKSKEDNTPWAVAIEAQSIGSGKKSSYTVPYSVYKKEKFNENDIINIKNWSKNRKGYFYINAYELVL